MPAASARSVESVKELTPEREAALSKPNSSADGCGRLHGLAKLLPNRFGRLTWSGPLRKEAVRLVRKEVIQPQVPLRLPCYDFAPVTGHTIGGCLPCGLAHRLPVQQASMA